MSSPDPKSTPAERLEAPEMRTDAVPHLEMDVAIIGGGVSGLYSGWRLATAQNRPQAIVLFEMSDRLGGRLESVMLPGMQIYGELGGMRYMPAHVMVTSLIEQVFNLPSVVFPMGDPAHLLFYMRTQQFRADAWANAQQANQQFITRYNVRTDALGFSSDQLFNKVVYDVLTADPWFTGKYASKVTNPSKYNYNFFLSAEEWNDVKPNLTYTFPGSPYNGMKVNDIGFWNLIKDREGQEAYEFLAVAGGYYSNTINWNAAEAFPYMVGDFSNLSTTYKTISTGYDQIAVSIARAFAQQPGTMIFRSRLIDFERNQSPVSSRRYALKFYSESAGATWTAYADSIILAMPRRSLELLNQFNFFLDPDTQHDRQANIASVIMEPSFKLLMGFETPWWTAPPLQATAGESITDLPMRQCYYFGTDPNDSHSLFLAAYNDMQTVPFWSVLEPPRPALAQPPHHHSHRHPHERLTATKHAKFAPRATRLASAEALAALADVQAPAVMVREAMAQIREMHGQQQTIPDPYVTWFKNWTEDPYGGGYHAWKAGVDVKSVMPYMRRPDPNEKIHVCGEAYSDQQGWVEGALCEAEKMLQEHFGLVWPAWLPKSYKLGW
jgi:monoamine oxidase